MEIVDIPLPIAHLVDGEFTYELQPFYNGVEKLYAQRDQEYVLLPHKLGEYLVSQGAAIKLGPTNRYRSTPTTLALIEQLWKLGEERQ